MGVIYPFLHKIATHVLYLKCKDFLNKDRLFIEKNSQIIRNLDITEQSF